MGTISEKLVYLNGTKQAIKQAINEDFEVIDNNTTFREYADKISSNNAKYKDLIPKETKNATNTLDISNSSGLDKALVTQYGNTYQETTTGKNLFKASSSNYPQGLNITYDSDKGTITFSGTTTGTYPTLSNFTEANIPAGTYTFSIDKTLPYNLSCRFRNSSGQYPSTVILSAGELSKSITLSYDTVRLELVYSVTEVGVTIPTTTIKPMMELGSTATNWEKYSGGNPAPNPDYPQAITNVTGTNTIKIVGKNLFDLSNITTGKTFTNTGAISSLTNSFIQEIYIPVSSETDYTMSTTNDYSSETDYRLVICEYDSNKNFIKRNLGGSATGNKYTITTSSTTKYVRLCASTVTLDELQFEKGSATTYEPYQEQSFDLDLKSKNLLPFPYTDTTKTSNGITFLVNSDGTITLNGTATSNATFRLLGSDSNQYNLTGNYITGGINGNIIVRAVNKTESYTVLGTSSGSPAQINKTTYTTGYIELRVLSGTEVNNQVVKPMLTMNSDNSYDSYKEQSFDLDLKSRNLFDSSLFVEKTVSDITLTKNNDGTITLNGTSTARADFTIIDLFSVIGDNKISSINRISGENTGNVVFGLYDKNWANGKQCTITSSTDKGSILLESNRIYTKCFIRIETGITLTNLTIGLQLEENSTPTEYEPYYNINLCEIGDYKDRIYPLNGKWYLEKKIGKVVLNGNEKWNSETAYTGYYRYTLLTLGALNSNNGLNNRFTQRISQAHGGYEYLFIQTNNGAIHIQLLQSRLSSSSIADFKTWLSNNNVTVYYVLTTPTTIEITESNYPTLYNQLNNIKLFEGVNHITMTNESGLDVEFDIEYYKDWKLD